MCLPSETILLCNISGLSLPRLPRCDTAACRRPTRPWSQAGRLAGGPPAIRHRLAPQATQLPYTHHQLAPGTNVCNMPAWLTCWCPAAAPRANASLLSQQAAPSVHPTSVPVHSLAGQTPASGGQLAVRRDVAAQQAQQANTCRSPLAAEAPHITFLCITLPSTALRHACDLGETAPGVLLRLLGPGCRPR
jgi:hypothetical protein